MAELLLLILAVIFALAIWALLLKLLALIFGKRPLLGKIKVLGLLSERKGENGMADLLTFKIGLPTSDSHDAVTKIVKVKEARVGGEVLEKELGVPVESAEMDIEVEQDSEVTLLVEILDDAGNKATTEEFVFTAADTLPPSIVGVIEVIGLTSESPAPDPVPDPVPDTPA